MPIRSGNSSAFVTVASVTVLPVKSPDLAELQQFLIKNPYAGDTMVGTGGLKKIRYPLKDEVKAVVPESVMLILHLCEKNYLIQVFSKDEKPNLTDSEKNAVKKVIAVLKAEAAKNWSQEHE